MHDAATRFVLAIHATDDAALSAAIAFEARVEKPFVLLTRWRL
jgi:hypothetical protein